MSEYTPTTSEIRDEWANIPASDASRREAQAEFDRWLAQVRREAKAEALREAADAIEDAPVLYTPTGAYENGQADMCRVVAAAMRFRANRIENGVRLRDGERRPGSPRGRPGTEPRPGEVCPVRRAGRGRDRPRALDADDL